MPHLKNAASIYGAILTTLSVIFGLFIIYNCYIFRKHNSSRFISVRKPDLILLYCFCGSIPSLLIISPLLINVNLHTNTELENEYIFSLWLLTFIQEIMISFMAIVIALRIWLLYYDHSYELSLVDQNWRGIINPNDKNFWLKHRKTFGDFGFSICFGIIMTTIIVILYSIISIHSLKGHTVWSLHAVSLFAVVLPCYLCIAGLILYGKHEKLFILSNDKFQIIREMQYLSISTLLMIIIYVLHLTNTVYMSGLQLVIETGQILFCLITSWIQNKWVIRQWKKENNSIKKNTELKQNNKDTIQFGMNDILQNKYGFGMFMRHCQNELCVELLLFIVEVAQFKAKLTDSLTPLTEHKSDPSVEIHSVSALDPSVYSISSSNASSGGITIPLPSLKYTQNIHGLNGSDNEVEIFESNIVNKEWLPIANQIFKPRNRKQSKYKKFSKVKERRNKPLSVALSVPGDTHNRVIELEHKDEEESNNMKNIKWIYSYAQYLFIKYIDVEAQFSINVSHVSREELLLFFSKDMNKGFEHILNMKGIAPIQLNEQCMEMINLWMYHMFDKALSEAWDLLQGDTFPRFMETDEYKYLLKQYSEGKLAEK